MPRVARMIIPGIPYHVLNRGNNKQVLFLSDEDKRFFFQILLEAKLKYSCQLYYYTLMKNHYHLMLNSNEKDTLSAMMKIVNERYACYFNKKHNRIGNIWQGRFKSSPIQVEGYFLACGAYIETNCVRALLVNHPKEYQWSSYLFHAFGQKDILIDMDPWYESLGNNQLERQKRYRKILMDYMSQKKEKTIREAINKGGITGNNKFCQKIEKIRKSRLKKILSF